MMESNFTKTKSLNDLCFKELDFTHNVFDTDTFLQKHKKHVRLEKMRDDLSNYLNILRSSMIQLINKDYIDFVTLSSNLIGLDQAINNLEIPLGQLKEEVIEIRQCLDDTISEVTSNFDKYNEIREQKHCIHSLIKFHKTVKKSNMIVGLCDTSESTVKPDVLERAATELNLLKFHANQCKTLLSAEQINEINNLDNYLNNHLSTLFETCIVQKEQTTLIRCLRIYISLEKAPVAEEIVRKKIVVPAVEDIISKYNFQNDILGLSGTYQKLERVLDTTLKELLELTLSSNRVSVSGFNFLVNSYWTEIEQRIEDYLPIIFAPGNPELFHKQYMETLKFLLTLEKKCGTPDSISQLKNHPQYQRFLKKWNLPVYFQIRFQEIAGTAESILCNNVSSASIRNNKDSINSNNFTLHATCIIWDCLSHIWTNEVYLPQLLHRFWKLCLQLCSRYHEWCQSSLKQTWPVNETSNNSDLENSQKLEFYVGLYTDIEKISAKISNFTELSDKIENFTSNVIDLLNDSIKETINNFESCLPLVTQKIVDELLQHSVTHLRQISDIPRLFRRTNREVPTKPCAYVKKSLDFLITFRSDYKNIIPQTYQKWILLALTSLTQQYISSVTDVLTSVQKTEESLKRLKKIRDKSTGISTSEVQGISDDEKIRIQLVIDVLGYIQMIKELDVNEDDIENLKKLLEIVKAATKRKIELK